MPRAVSLSRAVLTAALLVASASPCAAAPIEAASPSSPVGATEPAIHPTLAWAVTQLLPSPEAWLGSSGARFGLRWQVTPLLYSFGMNQKLSPWRAFVVEPLTRHSGSLELFVSPEYVAAHDAFADNWSARGGFRAYFPLVQRGDYLSCSVGGSALVSDGRIGASYEAGVYTMFGVLGVQVTYTPTPALRSTTLTLSLRYF